MEAKLSVPESINPVVAFGVHDSNLRLIERLTETKLFPKDGILVVQGEDAQICIASSALRSLFRLARGGSAISHDEIRILVEENQHCSEYAQSNIESTGVLVSKKGKVLKPRSLSQAEYLKKLSSSDLTFCTGPAGTGKTYLAVAMGINALISGQIKRLILSRPVLEAGENLGFLPGTLEEKIHPYIRPLLDAVTDMLSPPEVKYYMESDAVEIAPLAYMRGRTLSNAVVILDEAQNTTPVQMKMFLTRMGENCKMIVTGDISQTDLPRRQISGLRDAVETLQNIEEIAFHEFYQKDVVRHGLVKKIIEHYDAKETL